MRKQINNLENEIGVEILTRTPQGVFPSDAGRALYDYAQRLIALTDEAVSVCRHFTPEPRNSGCISGCTTTRTCI